MISMRPNPGRSKLRGERVLIDSNFENGALSGKAAAGESFDEALAAVRSRGWSGERLKVRNQVFAIIRPALPDCGAKDEPLRR